MHRNWIIVFTACLFPSAADAGNEAFYHNYAGIWRVVGLHGNGNPSCSASYPVGENDDERVRLIQFIGANEDDNRFVVSVTRRAWQLEDQGGGVKILFGDEKKVDRAETSGKMLIDSKSRGTFVLDVDDESFLQLMGRHRALSFVSSYGSAIVPLGDFAKATTLIDECARRYKAPTSLDEESEFFSSKQFGHGWIVKGKPGSIGPICIASRAIKQETGVTAFMFHKFVGGGEFAITIFASWWLIEGDGAFQVVFDGGRRETPKIGRFSRIDKESIVIGNVDAAALFTGLSTHGGATFVLENGDKSDLRVAKIEVAAINENLELCVDAARAEEARRLIASDQPGAGYVPEFDRFPANSTYSGRVRAPDFNGRDREYREYRTRIREEIARQRRSNFAGKFNLVPITQTGGVVFAVVESATGRIAWLNSLGGGPDYDFAFSKDSRLLVIQWSNGENCYRENYEWTGTQMLQIGESVGEQVDAERSCKHSLANSYANSQR